jgi:hypothetical protein
MYGLAPKDWGSEMDVMEDRSDALIAGYLPSLRGIHKEASFSTNSHGMRDREYSLEKPPDTYRIALLGASHDAGSGVNDGEAYESVLEDLLNANRRNSSQRFEVLNFSVDGYSPVQKLTASEMRVPAFQPDVILYAANAFELAWTFFRVEELMKREMLQQYPFFVEAMTQAGLDPQGEPVPQAVVERRLDPQAREVGRRILQRFAGGARERGAIPVLVLVDHPVDESRPEAFDVLLELGQEIGLEVIDLYGALSVEDRSTLWVAPWDTHVNAVGHRLLGEKLFQALLDRRLVPVTASEPRSEAIPAQPDSPKEPTSMHDAHTSRTEHRAARERGGNASE